MPFKKRIPRTGTIESILDTAHALGEMWADTFDVRHPASYLTKWAADHKEYDRKRITYKLGLDRGKIISLSNKLAPRSDEEMMDAADKEMENSSGFKTGEAANNVYTVAALRKWQKLGIKYVRRIEIQDEKICALCVVKNGETYETEDLMREDLPLTFDTHPHCRGSFIPIIGSITKKEDHVASKEHKATIVTAGNVVEDLPIEYKPFMVPFLSKVGKLPFKVQFKEDADYDWKIQGNKLVINPKSLDDADPREIIAKAKASQMYSSMGKKFKDEYGALIRMGLVHPNRSTQDWKEMFMNTYKEYMLNQLDEPYEVLWCKSNFSDTSMPKAASVLKYFTG